MTTSACPVRLASVTAGVALLAGGLVAFVFVANPGYIGTGLAIGNGFAQNVTDFSLTLAFIVCVAIGALLIAVAFGERWALYTMLVLCLLSLNEAWSIVTGRPEGNVATPVWVAAALAVEALGFTFLFSRPARRWFADLRSPPGSPSGWYPDPSGRYELRFWAGSDWTAHVADSGQSPLDLFDDPGDLAPPVSDAAGSL